MGILKNKGVIAMYKKILLITSILIIGGCAEKKEVVLQKDIIEKKSKKNEIQINYNMKNYYKSGELKAEILYKNDKENGLMKG